ncbi:MAG: L,D-transpeptidase family protein [Schleiferiaceae bacterium]|nr:L,D-transpeptidase family protein [Schleiferiaceae bacterium]
MNKTGATIFLSLVVMAFAYLSFRQLSSRIQPTVLPQTEMPDESADSTDETRTDKAAYMLSGHETVASVLQKLGPRVNERTAEHLAKAGFSDYPEKALIVVLKEEQQLEVYGWRDGKWRFINFYWFTANSGELGPKLKQGDRQIPEGLYTLEYLNPNSKFWLSGKVSYPNAFDKAKAKADGRDRLGGDIFIHGKAMSIGCVAIGDASAEEVFFFMAHHTSREPLEIIISPVDFRKGKAVPTNVKVSWYPELCEIIKQRLEELPFSSH